MALKPDVSLKLSADGTAVVSELKKVRGELDGFASAAKTAIAAISVGAVTAFADQLITAADELGDTAQRVGTTAEQLQVLRLAAEDFGASAETADRALSEFNARLGKAVSDGGAAAKSFENLGLSARKLAEAAPDEALLSAADAIARAGTQAEKTAAATELFGKAGKELVPLLSEGRKGIEDLATAYKRSGLILSNETVAAVGEAERALRLVGVQSRNTATEFLGGLSPALVAIGTDLRDAGEAFGGLSEVGGKTGAVLLTAIEVIKNGVASLEAAFFGLAAAGARVFQALTFGDVSESFAASVDANLAKATDALGKIQSIEQIQATIVAKLETANAAIAAAKAAETAGTTKTATEVLPASDAGTGGFNTNLPNFEAEAAKLRAQAAADVENEISRTATDALNTRLEAYSNYNDLYLALTGSRIEQELALEELKNQSWGQLLGTALASFGAHNQKVAKIAQAIAIAQAIWNTATGVTKALAAYDYAGAAAIAIAGAAQIAKIKSTKYTGTVVSGGESFAAGAAGGATSSPNNDVFNPQNGTSAFEKRAIRVELVGELKDSAGRVLAGLLAKEIKDNDVVIIDPTSRQAQELQG